jgi:hypothetical protein
MLLITIFVELRVVAGRSRTQAGRPKAVSRRPCCAMALRRTAWSENGMASVNQTRPHCVNQIGKTRSKALAARHGRGTAWARHAMCETAFMQALPRNEVSTGNTTIATAVLLWISEAEMRERAASCVLRTDDSKAVMATGRGRCLFWKSSKSSLSFSNYISKF